MWLLTEVMGHLHLTGEETETGSLGVCVLDLQL